ncbi:MAG: glycosyltransferase family 9 protein [Actinomycetota bacterium]|nr:glycosyltransferase family 9 protein [Actinomycetota bacterium]
MAVSTAVRRSGPPRVVVLRALGLGDLCTAVPALRGLRRRFPDHRLTVLTPQALWPLAGLTDVLDELIDQPDLAAPLPRAACEPELAVNLHGCGPQSTRLLADAHPRRLLAFAHPDVGGPSSSPPWRADEHEVDRWCRLVGSAGAACDRTDVLLRRPASASTTGDDSGVAGGSGRARGERSGVLVHPGAASVSRQWPPARFGAVVRAVLDCGRPVTITGASAEVGIAAAVVEAANAAGDPHCVMAAGRTDLAALARLVADAELVVAGDTGIAHLATAFATPSVLLFGPTDPAHWGPTTAGPHQVLWFGSTGDPHGAHPDAGLLEISVSDVVAAIDRSPLRSTSADLTSPTR